MMSVVTKRQLAKSIVVNFLVVCSVLCYHIFCLTSNLACLDFYGSFICTFLDTDDLRGNDCISFGYSLGDLNCNNDCTFNFDACELQNCGNNEADPLEYCDGSDLRGLTCIDFGYTSGTLGCTNCMFSFENCQPSMSSTCSNSNVEPGEQCDGTDLNEKTCTDFGFAGGTLSCSDNCMFDLTDCRYSICGNNKPESGEQCDGTALNGKDCRNFGFAGGTLKCADCMYDLSACNSHICGNNILESGEQCDGSLNEATCSSLGFASGDLACKDCMYDLSGCEPKTVTKTKGCFSGEATVDVLGRGLVMMKDLKLNDKVLTGSKNDYQPVYSFGHLDKEMIVEYLQIYTDDKELPLEVSPDHLVFLADSKSPVRADQIKKGDMVYKSMGPIEVTKIKSVTRKGAYLPLTPDGTIVVNGVLASAYVSISKDSPTIIHLFGYHITEQTLFHWWLSPYRMVCMGLSSKVCEDDFGTNNVIHWLNLGHNFAKFGEQQVWWLQMVGISLVMGALLAFVALEAVFGAQAGIAGLVLTGIAFHFYLTKARKMKME
jgi:hypothetical protein